MYTEKDIDRLLTAKFVAKHVHSFVSHYSAMLDEYYKGDWESVILKSGKFVEALLKSMWLHVGGTLLPARQFKVGRILTDLRQLQQGTYDDTIRVTIPKACEFIYDIASNRGARHDPDEVNPNEMDANAVVSMCSWLLGEVLRYSQKGVADVSVVQEQLNIIVKRRYPYIEDIDGRTYFHFRGLSARNVGLLYLRYMYPVRVTSTEVLNTIVRHKFSRKNAIVATSRLRKVVDIDNNNKLVLLQPGVKEADEIIKYNLSKVK